MLQKNNRWPYGVSTQVEPLHRATRRSALRMGLTGAVALGLPWLAQAHNGFGDITVWKTPDCGCCKAWVTHLQKSGFEVVANDVKDTAPIRLKLGMPEKLGSCHTATLGDYVLEGHVPAREIRQLLRDKPKALGLAVPGMPIGSPGMDLGGARDAFSVMLVLHDGSSRVYKSYPAITSSTLNPNFKETS